MSKRARLPREQRRRTLVDAAREIVVQRGYLELTMGRVASRAGVSKTLVYDHFAHRRELYLAVLAEEQVRLVQRLAPALVNGDGEERVRSGVRAFLELVDEYGDGWSELFRNPIAQDPELAVELRRVREGVAEMLAGIIAADIGSRPESVLLHAHALVGTMEAAADWLTRVPAERRPALDRTTDVLSRMIWQGLDGLRSLDLGRPAGGEEPVPLRPRRGAESR
jgi:AcrR family transcriptional regulator